MSGLLRFGALVATAMVLGCGPGGPDASAPQAPAEPAAAVEPAPAAKAPEDAVAQAAFVFETRCFTCHGKEGAGDGPGSAALDPKPRNFKDASWQSSVTDEHIGQIIQYGGAAVGKSPTMPGNPDLMSKPDVVAALVTRIRGLSAP